MKVLLTVIALGITLCGNAQLVTNQPARLKNKIICYEGKIGSGTSGTCLNLAPEANYPGNSGKETVTSPGHESALQWTFIGRNKDRDVYQFTFTRLTKAGSSTQTTATKQIQFDGKRIVVFEDDLHVVLIESPSEEDLKPVQEH